jgi:hypothetical protein
MYLASFTLGVAVLYAIIVAVDEHLAIRLFPAAVMLVLLPEIFCEARGYMIRAARRRGEDVRPI